MALSDSLISQFVKATKDDNKTKKESTVYGTVVVYGGLTYVRIDGSDLLTPITTTAKVNDGDRVIVSIKDHSAIITGNTTSPSASNKDVEEVSGNVTELNNKVEQFNIVLADKVSTDELAAEQARIKQLEADNVTINEKLTANEGYISNLEAENVVINQKLTAHDGELETLKTTKLDAETANITFATITDLEATNAEVYNFKATYGEFVDLTAENFEAVNADIKNLDAEKISADVAELTYATITSLEATDAKIVKLEADHGDFKTLTMEQFTAISGDIEDLTATKLDATTANLTFATITDLDAAKGRITDLETTSLTADSAVIKTLQSDVADIDTLIFGTAGGTSIQTTFANAVIAQLGDAQIKSAMIDSVTASKITSGDIITNNVRVMSEDGSLLISDETIQISDSSRVRVQIGKDASGDYSINIWDADGNLMFSEGGITDSAIKEAIIRNDMVSETANISASKLDIDSLFTEINDSTNVIKSTKIYLDDEGQTLDVSFKTMSSTVDELSTNVSSQGTDISVIQGQISSKIWQTDIDTAVSEVDAKTETLTTQYSELNQDLDGLTATVASHTTQIANKADGTTVTNLSSKVTKIEEDLDGFKSTVSETYVTQTDYDERMSSVDSAIEQNAADIKLRVTTTDFNSYKSTVTESISNAKSDAISEAKAYTSQEITTVNNSLNTTNQEISVMKGEIALKVEQSDIDTAVTTVKNYTDDQVEELSTEVTSISNTVASHTTDLNGITSRVESTETDITSINDEIDSIESRVSAAELKITDSAIISTVSGTYATKTELTQTSESLTVKITTAQNSADDAAKVATNYLSFSGTGLVVGDLTASTLGNNVLIDTDSVDIRNGTKVLASYQANTIYLGLDDPYQTTIDFCNGMATFSTYADQDEWNRMVVNSEYGMYFVTSGQIQHTTAYSPDSGQTEYLARITLTSNTPWGGSDFLPAIDLRVTNSNGVTKLYSYSTIEILDNHIRLDSYGEYQALTRIAVDGDMNSIGMQAQSLSLTPPGAIQLLYINEVSAYVRPDLDIGGRGGANINGYNNGYSGIHLDAEGFIQIQRNSSSYHPYVAFYLNGSTTTADGMIRVNQSSGYMQFLQADRYTFDSSVVSSGSVFTNGKTSASDGVTGALLSNAGRLHLQNTTGSPVIYFYGDSTSSGANIAYNITNETVSFNNAAYYVFDATVYPTTVYASGSMRIGRNDTPDSMSSRAIGAVWNDGSVHNLIERYADGLTSGFGWVGSSSYATVTRIRGRTCQYQNSSGTTALSDERLKYDFTELDRWDSWFDSIKPWAFKMKTGNSGRYHFGFSAQQVEESLFNNNLTSKDFAGYVKLAYHPDEDDPEGTAIYEAAGIREGDFELGLIYTEFTAMNTWQIQKLKAIVSAQDEKIANLKAEIAELKKAS